MVNNVKRYSFFLTFIIFLLLIICVPSRVYGADAVESYEVKKYDLDVEVNKDHTYDVDLKMTVSLPADFSTLRAVLPSGSYVISDLKADGYPFTVSQSGTGRELLITGLGGKNKCTKKLAITYKISEYADRNPANDMFYYDAISPNWQEPIYDFVAKLHMPEDFDWQDLQYYAGQFGTQDVSDKLDCTVKGNTIILKGKMLPSNFGITFKAQLPDGYWVGAIDNTWTMNFSILMMAIVCAVIALLWLAGGRDPKVPHNPERHPIEGLSPADVGYLLYGKMRIKDVVALIVYLAIKGYLRIVEYQPKRYKLIKLNEPKEEERYIRGVYNILFEDVYEGRAVEMEDLGGKLKSIYNNVESSIASGYSTKDMKACTTLSKVLRVVSMVILAISVGAESILADMYVYKEPSVYIAATCSIIAFVALGIINWVFDNRYQIEGPIFWLSIILSGVAFELTVCHGAYVWVNNTDNFLVGIALVVFSFVAVVITLFMKSRAIGNAELAGRLRGLRHFMARAQADDLAQLNRENPDYYYELVPYALLFSMTETWARKFNWIKATSPFFFETEQDGNAMSRPITQKSTDAIARDLKTFSRTIESEYHAMLRKKRR